MSARFVSIEEAADILGIGRSTAYELAKKGEFPVPLVKVGSKWKASSYRLDQLLGIDAKDVVVNIEGASVSQRELTDAVYRALTKKRRAS